ncbi:hypothetical protein [Myroides sp. WP-1]|uniref:hypothetical protein n=1 Tax=Myroides sp. WP-1 TaxID=2759944 RepID=UPI0015FD44F7|nr:hypothetical protein [Myroides sp. WP-1]MBB1140062.1 hypothetical protein [Myroides sp. WP-1]
MKHKYIYGLFTLFLCFGFKAQAQRVVAYQTKLSELTVEQAQEFSAFLAEDYNDHFVNFRAFQNTDLEVEEIAVIDLKWNGQDVITLPTRSIQRMSKLKYIYLRSHQVMDDNYVKQRFSALIRQLERLGNEVEIVYFIMEKPN